MFTAHPVDILLLLPRLAIFITGILPLTLLLYLVPLTFYVVLTGLGATFCAPLMICSGLPPILIFLLYPLLCAFSLVGFIMGLFLYPCYRNRDHHGIYDSLDKLIVDTSICYLQIVNCFLNILLCRFTA